MLAKSANHTTSFYQGKLYLARKFRCAKAEKPPEGAAGVRTQCRRNVGKSLYARRRLERS